LVLIGVGSFVQRLLELPGGIRFRSIEADSQLQDLAEVLAACSSTLEVLDIRCFESGKSSTLTRIRPLKDHWARLGYSPNLRLRDRSDGLGSGEMLSVNLGCHGVLRRFELAVDFVELDILPPFVRETLASVSSPHFSEFSLRLCPRLGFSLWRGASDRRTFWGAGWEVVDEDLYVRATRRDGFRFAIQIVPGESKKAAVEALFPRMKSLGSLLITKPQPWWR